MAPRFYLFRRSNGFYYIRIVLEDGGEKWKSTGEKQRQKAIVRLNDEKRLFAPKKRVRIKLSAFKDEVLKYVEATFAPKTLETYRLSFQAFLRIHGDEMIHRITTQHVDRFKARRLSEVSPASVNIQLRTLRAAFNLACGWGMLEDNPFAAVKQVTVPQKLPTYFTPEQLQSLLSQIHDHWLRDVVVFAVNTGMRQGEILNLTWNQVLPERRVVLVQSRQDFRTKAGKARVVPMNGIVESLLTERRQGTGDEEHVFTFNGRMIRRDTLTHKFKKAVRFAGLPERLCFHSLRHTFASYLAQAGVSLYHIAALLGHSDVKTTRIYSHLREEGLADTVHIVEQVYQSRQLNESVGARKKPLLFTAM